MAFQDNSFQQDSFQIVNMASAFQHFSISAFQGNAFQVSSSTTYAQSVRPFTKERRQITMQQLPLYRTFRS